MILNKHEIHRLIHPLLGIWDNQVAILWAGLVTRAFNKNGLLYYESHEQEMVVRERLILSAVFYREILNQLAFHDSEYFSSWDHRLEATLKNDFSAEVDDNLQDVKNALINFFGSGRELLANIYLNCRQGDSNLIYTLEELEKARSNFYTKLDRDDFNISQALTAIYQIDSIGKLTCLF